MTNETVPAGTNQSSKESFNWKPVGNAFAIALATALGGCLVKVVYESYKKEKIDTPAKIKVDNANTENKIKVENAKKDAERILNETKSRVKIEEEMQLSAVRIKELEKKKAIELEYAQKMAMLKRGASNDNNGTTQPDPNWEEPCSYNDMRTRTDIKTTPIVPGYIEEGLINGIVGGAGVAKSILMRQLALAIDTGGEIGILPDYNAPQRDVLFYRFEEFAGEEEKKYGRGDIYANSGIMWRTKSDIKNFTLQGIIEDLSQVAFHIGNNTVVFLDPITKLSNYNADKFITGAEQAMDIAKGNGYTLTIVVSAHLEEQESWKPATSDKIKGGDSLIQKAGSVMAICRERTGGIYRFLKCLKSPKGYQEPSDVIVCKIEKLEIDEHNWNTRMSYVCRKKEEGALSLKLKPAPDDNADNIMQHPKSKEDKMLNKVLMAEKMKNEENLTDEELAKKMHVSRQTISNWRKFLEKWRKNHPDVIEGVE